jgi:hypothetical protein
MIGSEAAVKVALAVPRRIELAPAQLIAQLVEGTLFGASFVAAFEFATRYS